MLCGDNTPAPFDTHPHPLLQRVRPARCIRANTRGPRPQTRSPSYACPALFPWYLHAAGKLPTARAAHGRDMLAAVMAHWHANHCRCFWHRQQKLYSESSAKLDAYTASLHTYVRWSSATKLEWRGCTKTLTAPTNQGYTRVGPLQTLNSNGSRRPLGGDGLHTVHNW